MDEQKIHIKFCEIDSKSSSTVCALLLHFVWSLPDVIQQQQNIILLQQSDSPFTSMHVTSFSVFHTEATVSIGLKH